MNIKQPAGGWVLLVGADAALARARAEHFRRFVAVAVAHTVEEVAPALSRPGMVGAVVDARLGRADGIAAVAVPAKGRFPRADVRIVVRCARELGRAARSGFWVITTDHDPDAIRELAPRWGEDASRVEASNDTVEARLSDLLANGTLTRAQVDTLRLAAEGVSYRDIARRLGISRQAIDGMSLRIREATGRTLKDWARHVCDGTDRKLRW